VAKGIEYEQLLKYFSNTDGLNRTNDKESTVTKIKAIGLVQPNQTSINVRKVRAK
jgi:hypothetical protein